MCDLYLNVVWDLSNKSKYAKWYINIIKNTMSRNFKNKKQAKMKLGYVEQHHILPRSIKLSNEKNNLVFLTAREHFICHLLLAKMFNDFSYIIKMEQAAWMLINGTRQGIKVTAKIFEILKQANSVNSSNLHKGRIDSETTRKKKSISLLGHKNNVGRKHSEETKKLMSMVHSGENHEMYGKHHTEESKRKMSDAHAGEKNHFYGQTHTEEICKIISEKNKLARKKQQQMVDEFDKWILNNELPDDIIWKGKYKGFPEKLFYVKELIKRNLIKI